MRECRNFDRGLHRERLERREGVEVELLNVGIWIEMGFGVRNHLRAYFSCDSICPVFNCCDVDGFHWRAMDGVAGGGVDGDGGELLD